VVTDDGFSGGSGGCGGCGGYFGPSEWAQVALGLGIVFGNSWSVGVDSG
jgi:hypothetical protein